MEKIKTEFIKEYNKLVHLFKQNKINSKDFENILNYKFLDSFTIDLIKKHLKYGHFEYCIIILYNIGKKHYF